VRPQTNGKIERFHRTMADGWAYARCYRSQMHGSPPGGRPGGLWGCLLALQQPHVGGLGALRPLRGVELDDLALFK
jgi:hypothetical protein